MNNLVPLNKQEFKHLVNKVNNNCVPVDYFRKNLFNATIKDSYDLKIKKTIYKDNNLEIKVDRSLNQKHRDLFSLLMNEKKSMVSDTGTFFIKTRLYQLAKKMGYKYPAKATNYIDRLLTDMKKTIFYISKNNKRYDHSLLGEGYYDKENDEYIVEIPSATAKYSIYTTGVSIPQVYNEKIVQISDNKAKLKALISFLLSNAKLENGIYFNTICNKLNIQNTVKNPVKSKFKKQVQENLELLKQFKIKFEDDKFYLKKEKCTFYPALSEKQILSFEKSEDQRKYDEVLERLLNTNVDKIITTATQNDRKIFIKNTEEKKLAFYSENNAFERFMTDNEIRNLVNFIKL